MRGGIEDEIFAKGDGGVARPGAGHGIFQAAPTGFDIDGTVDHAQVAADR